MDVALLVLVVVLVVAALVFGVVSLLTGDDPGLATVDADSRALPLANDRALAETDLKAVRFDVELRGYRMAQVDRVLRRVAYDVGYKDEMIAVLEAEVIALRDGRSEDAELLRKAREAAASPSVAAPGGRSGAAPGGRSGSAYAGRGIEVTGGPLEPEERRDNHREETEQRLEQDEPPALTEDPEREPAGEPKVEEEHAPRG
jgi:DivIVA domain-containing protein